MSGCTTIFYGILETKTREQANIEFIKSSLASYIEMLTSLNAQRVSFLCAFLVRRGRSKTSSASGPSPHQGAQQSQCLPVPLCYLPKLWCASKGLLVLKSWPYECQTRYTTTGRVSAAPTFTSSSVITVVFASTSFYLGVLRVWRGPSPFGCCSSS